MKEKFNLPRGTYDILPEDSGAWEYVQRTFMRIASLYGYQPIVTPIFESSNLFERSVGDSSDIVRKEMYRFQDRKGRWFALRPEGTAPVVRSYVENGMGQSFQRVCYMGPMFRYDRPQKGRYRQFYQYGIENFGSNHPFTDAEVIAMAVHFLKTLGLRGYRLEINSVGSIESMPVYDQALREYYSEYTDQLCPDCLQRIETNPRRLLDCKVETCRKIAEDAPVILDYLDQESKEHFQTVQEYLDLMKISYTVNPKIVRGLDYYCHTAFEIIGSGQGTQDALIGGGRYNGLVEQIGGRETPAIGFAGGFERLFLAMKAENIDVPQAPAPDIYLAVMGKEATILGIGILCELRSRNIFTVFDVDKSSLKAQLKAADKSGARYALIIGDDEIRRGIMVLKSLETRSQQDIALDDINSVEQVLGTPSLFPDWQQELT